MTRPVEDPNPAATALKTAKNPQDVYIPGLGVEFPVEDPAKFNEYVE